MTYLLTYRQTWVGARDACASKIAIHFPCRTSKLKARSVILISGILQSLSEAMMLFGVFNRLMVQGDVGRWGCNIKELKGGGSVHKHVFVNAAATELQIQTYALKRNL